MTACCCGYESAEDGGGEGPHWDLDGTEKAENPDGNERR